MSAGPVFGQDDRVDQPTGLPAELVAKLQGKSVAEQTRLIVEYYQTREKTIIQKAKEAIRTQDPSTIDQPPKPPVNRVQTERADVVDQKTVDGATITLIAAAKNQAKIGKKYWDRFEAEIEKIMAGMDPQFRVNFQFWETAYNNCVGLNYDLIQKEEKDAEARAATLTAERANAAPEPTLPPAPLPEVVRNKVLPGLGLTEEQYRTGQKNLETGKWPLTFDKAARP